MKILKVIIIGGGIGGLSCARACLDAGLEVELYEKRSQDQMLSGPGGIQIQKNAMRIYELLGQGVIKNQLYDKGGKILKGGFFNKNFVPLYINSPKFASEDDLGVGILRPQLQEILYNALPEGIVRNNANFIGFEETTNGIEVRFDNGQITTGDLLVGADGLYSKVRAKIQGKEKLEDPIYSGMKSQNQEITASLRQFEQNRSQRVKKVFTTSRQIGELGQTNTVFGCGLRNWLYRLTPTWLGDLQFKWLFDYQPNG